MSNIHDNLPEWQDPGNEYNERPTDTEEIDLLPSNDGRGDGSHDMSAMHFVFFVSVCVVLAAGWVMYIVNRTWYMGALTILIGVGCGLLAYRVRSSIESSFILSGLAVFNAWLVYFVHPTPAVFGLAVLCLLFIPLMILRYLRGSLDEAEYQAEAKLKQGAKTPVRVRKMILREEAVWQAERQHPASLTGWLALLLAATALLLWLRSQAGTSPFVPVLLVLWISVVLFVAIRLLKWLDYCFCFTSLRVVCVKGIFTKNYPVIPLIKLTEVEMTLPWHSRLLAALRIVKVRYGTFNFETAGQEQSIKIVTFVPNAIAINRKYSEHMLQPANEEEGGD